MTAWVIAALRPTGPYPILVLHGEQDSGKTTTSRVLRRLVDPHKTLLKRTIRDDRDLFIAANNQHVLALDNLSHLQPWLSDALCTISTGGGYSTRRLHTDDEEVNFHVIRPILLNGIEDIATRADFMDRAVILTLPSIVNAERRDEVILWRDFGAAHSSLFGALLDAISHALRTLPEVTLAERSERPRMLDFARWASAAAPACSWRVETPDGELTGAEAFEAAYLGNRYTANATTLEASEVAQALLNLIERAGGWRGTATELLQVLRTTGGKGRNEQFPKSADKLSSTLRRLAPNLRKVGIHLDFTRSSGGRARPIIIRREQNSRAQ
jgi:hypothetical protein